MATLRPFQGLRFTAKAGSLDDLVAPPYDVLSPEERDRFAHKNEHNVVHMTLPEQMPDDRSKYVKYARSASRLEAWRTEGALGLESTPAYYRYRQTFEIPGRVGSIERTSVIATIKVEPYEKGVVLPHEQTFPKHKEDRLRILEATRSHLECIYGLYEDDDRSVHALVHDSIAEQVADVTTEDGVRHVVELISDPGVCAKISAAMGPKKVWIADGHHRYETACTFRAALGDKPGEVPEDYMMMALSSIADPGLVLLPTHRILKKLPITVDEAKQKLGELFDLEPAPKAELMARIEAIGEAGGRALGIALPGGSGLVAKVRNLEALAAQGDTSRGARLAQLDVSILHDVVFGKLFGLSGHDFFDYTRDPAEAVSAVENGAPAAFLMNPPTVEDMRHIALGGEKMPQKSTFYYPKILSGLVLWSLNDFS